MRRLRVSYGPGESRHRSKTPSSRGTMAVLELVATVFAFLLAVCVYRLWLHPLSRFPGPPLLSATYVPHLWRNCVTGLWVRDISRLHREYGPVVRIGPNHLSVDGSLAWSDVFANRPGRREYPKQPGFHGPEGRYSIIGAPSSHTHRWQRRRLARGFSESALADQEPVIARYVDKLARRMAEFSDRGRVVNVVDWFKFTTFDIIGDLTFGEKFQCLDSGRYHPLAAVVFDAIRENGLRRVLLAYHLNVPTWVVSRISLFRKFIEIQAWSEQRARARISLGVKGRDGRSDFFTHLLETPRDADQVMTERELIANSLLLVVAGSDTTATALVGLFFYLAQNRQACDALKEEIRSTFATESDINPRNCAPLAFLGACIQETLRLYPPSPEVPTRLSPGDVLDGRSVPAGTFVSVYLTSTFRNPHHFLDPDCFRPQRWLPESHPQYESRFRGDRPSVFKPFSYGPRDCLGQTLALAEIRLITARLLHRFDFDLLPGQDEWQAKQRMYVVWEKPPLHLRFRPR